VTTLADVVRPLLAAEPGRPLVTFYDHASGERTELSVVTWTNWVAKTASLLVEELDLERGQVLRVDLPAHWLGPVVLGAAWTVGLVVDLDGTGGAPDAVVCGPDGVGRWSGAGAPVVASALLPLGVRFPDPLPDGVLDLGVEVWSQPDAFAPWDPPTGADEALPGTTQEALWAAASADPRLAAGDRVLATANPASDPAVFAAPLARGGSLVLVAHADDDRLDRLAEDERVTARWP
jgi:uncharacterized protein (TIGR03089 family)